MRAASYHPGRSYDLTFERGEDINEAIRTLCRTEGIDEAVVTAGLGGFGHFCLEFPGIDAPTQRSWQDVVLQLSAVQGFVRGGEPQLTATVTVDGSDPLTWSGRVGDGSARLFYCELMLTELIPAP